MRSASNGNGRRFFCPPKPLSLANSPKSLCSPQDSNTLFLYRPPTLSTKSNALNPLPFSTKRNSSVQPQRTTQNDSRIPKITTENINKFSYPPPNNDTTLLLDSTVMCQSYLIDQRKNAEQTTTKRIAQRRQRHQLQISPTFDYYGFQDKTSRNQSFESSLNSPKIKNLVPLSTKSQKASSPLRQICNGSTFKSRVQLLQEAKQASSKQEIQVQKQKNEKANTNQEQMIQQFQVNNLTFKRQEPSQSPKQTRLGAVIAQNSKEIQQERTRKPQIKVLKLGRLPQNKNEEMSNFFKEFQQKVIATNSNVQSTPSSKISSPMHSLLSTDTSQICSVTKKQPQLVQEMKSKNIQTAELKPSNSDLQKMPLEIKDILRENEDQLSDLEKQELLGFKDIYFFSKNKPKINNKTGKLTLSDDNEEIIVQQGDHLAYRYEVIKNIGTGSFGSVFKVLDHKLDQLFALKIIRNLPKSQKQSLSEINILSVILERDKHSSSNIITFIESFIFRNHTCMIFELLSMNLYELLETNDFKGMSMDLARRISIQILNALFFLQRNQIIHCDLKPENILLKVPNKSGLKVIDFGSSCFLNQKIYSYIQSRYYRAPEIMLGFPYDYAIDIWSFGCILAEILLGSPLFPGDSEQEQMELIQEVIGPPPRTFLQIQIQLLIILLMQSKLIYFVPNLINQKCKRRKVFFNEDFSLLDPSNTSNKSSSLSSNTPKKPLNQIFCNYSDTLVDFLTKCFQWEPEKRLDSLSALTHEWILEGLPLQTRIQHLKHFQSQADQDDKKNEIIQNQKIIDDSSKININNKPARHQKQQHYSSIIVENDGRAAFPVNPQQQQ